MKGSKLVRDLIDAKTQKVIATAGTKMTPARSKACRLRGGINFVSDNDLLGRFVAEDVVNLSTGEVYVEAGDELSEDTLAKLAEASVEELSILFIDNVNFGPHLRNTLAADRNTCRADALIYMGDAAGRAANIERPCFIPESVFQQ